METKMKILIEESYEDLSETVAAMILSCFYQDKRVNVDLTDGSSPQGAFEIVGKVMKQYPERFRNVHFYQHDELEGEERMVYNILRKQIHEPFGISKENIHIMDFDKKDDYIEKIKYDGGLDFMLLGLGADAHFCANFPYTNQLEKLIYEYDPKNYSWHDDYCKAYKMDKLPKIVTFGFGSVLRAKQIVMVVNGKKKAQAVKDMLTKPISSDFPATILRMHPNMVLVLDQEAASLMNDDLKN